MTSLALQFNISWTLNGETKTEKNFVLTTNTNVPKVLLKQMKNRQRKLLQFAHNKRARKISVYDLSQVFC